MANPDWKINEMVENQEVRKSAIDLPETNPFKEYEHWSDPDLDYIKENVGKIPMTEIAAHVGRTELAVRNKLYSVGYNEKTAVTNLATVAFYFGVTPQAVLNWVRNGLLRARRSPVIAFGRTHAWNVSDRAIEDFIHDRQPNSRWHWQDMPPGHWRDYARRVWEGRDLSEHKTKTGPKSASSRAIRASYKARSPQSRRGDVLATTRSEPETVREESSALASLGYAGHQEPFQRHVDRLRKVRLRRIESERSGLRDQLGETES